MRNCLGLVITLTLVVAVISCKKTENFRNSPEFAGDPVDYMIPLVVGKYAIYRMDSLNYYYYGQKDTITSYLAKDSVEKSFTDGSGSVAWLVTRYLSDTTGVNWTASQTNTVTPKIQQLYVTEENQRFLKLSAPIAEGFTWLGNSALSYDPYHDFFQFSDDSHLSLNQWNYTYQNVSQPFVLGNTNYDSTATVLQVNDSINVPIVDTQSFASRTYWVETYAKHIGLVYRQTKMWEYQPPTPDGTQSGYKIGFELTMKLISHN